MTRKACGKSDEITREQVSRVDRARFDFNLFAISIRCRIRARDLKGARHEDFIIETHLRRISR